MIRYIAILSLAGYMCCVSAVSSYAIGENIPFLQSMIINQFTMILNQGLDIAKMIEEIDNQTRRFTSMAQSGIDGLDRLFSTMSNIDEVQRALQINKIVAEEFENTVNHATHILEQGIEEQYDELEDILKDSEQAIAIASESFSHWGENILTQSNESLAQVGTMIQEQLLGVESVVLQTQVSNMVLQNIAKQLVAMFESSAMVQKIQEAKNALEQVVQKQLFALEDSYMDSLKYGTMLADQLLSSTTSTLAHGLFSLGNTLQGTNHKIIHTVRVLEDTTEDILQSSAEMTEDIQEQLQEQLTQGVDTAQQALTQTITQGGEVLDKIETKVEDTITEGKNVLSDAQQNISQGVSQAVNDARTTLQGTTKTLQSEIQNRTDQALQETQSIITSVQEFSDKVEDRVKDGIYTGTELVNTLEAQIDNMLDDGSQIAYAIQQNIEQMVESGMSANMSTLYAMKNVVDTMIRQGIDEGNKTLQELQNAIHTMIQARTTEGTNILHSLQQEINTLLHEGTKEGKSMLQSLTHTIDIMIHEEIVRDDSLQESSRSFLKNTFRTLGNTIKTGVNKSVDTITRTLSQDD